MLVSFSSICPCLSSFGGSNDGAGVSDAAGSCAVEGVETAGSVLFPVLFSCEEVPADDGALFPCLSTFTGRLRCFLRRIGGYGSVRFCLLRIPTVRYFECIDRQAEYQNKHTCDQDQNLFPFHLTFLHETSHRHAARTSCVYSRRFYISLQKQ